MGRCNTIRLFNAKKRCSSLSGMHRDCFKRPQGEMTGRARDERSRFKSILHWGRKMGRKRKRKRKRRKNRDKTTG